MAGHRHHGDHMAGSPYLRLSIMLALSFIIMFALMYTMVAGADDVIPNLNMAYMALTMALAMAPLELLLMRHMYPNVGLNIAFGIGAVVLVAAAIAAIRFQTGIGDIELLRAMIPHHSGAVLMCREADLADSEVRALCGRIIASQEAEILEMKALLAR